MSRLEERTAAVLTDGRSRRGEWDPDPDSPHWKLYQYWRRSTGRRYYASDNFCHYWRVVLIWAPLRWLTTPLRSVWFLLLCVIAIMTAFAYLLASTGNLMGFLVMISAVLYCVVGGMFASHLMTRRQSSPTWAWSWLERSAYRTVLTILIGLALLPVLVICAVLIGLVMAIMWLGWLLFEKLALQYWFLGAHPRRAPWLRPVTVAGACFLAAGVINASRGNIFGQVVIGTTVAVAGLAALVAGIAFLGSIYDTRHKAKMAQVALSNARRTTDYIMRRRFELEHPEWAADDDRYCRWRKRFEQYLMAIHQTKTIDKIKPEQILVHVRMQFVQRYPHLVDVWGYLLADDELTEAINGTAGSTQPKSSKVRAATSLLAFIWSVIRVTKWRICPLVQLPVR